MKIFKLIVLVIVLSCSNSISENSKDDINHREKEFGYSSNDFGDYPAVPEGAGKSVKTKVVLSDSEDLPQGDDFIDEDPDNGNPYGNYYSGKQYSRIMNISNKVLKIESNSKNYLLVPGKIVYVEEIIKIQSGLRAFEVNNTILGLK